MGVRVDSPPLARFLPLPIRHDQSHPTQCRLSVDSGCQWRAILVIEFQMYPDPQIYGQVVVEMANMQEEHAGREVQGISIFGSKDLDPKRAPWSQVVSVYYLDEMLAELEKNIPRTSAGCIISAADRKM